MKTLPVLKEDVIKSANFIICLAQDQSGNSMYGTLSGKGDLIGGIFDRFINIFPETIVFNNYILKEVANGHEVEVVRDNYSYSPNIAGIAPDVIGIRVDGKVIPFAVFDDQWKPVDGMPQIEVKTCKKADKMFSIRNQGYDDKILVIVETDFRIDYLIPLLDERILDESIYDESKLDDKYFIKSNVLNTISHFDSVKHDFNDLGTVSVTRITKGIDFMNNSTFCDAGVSVERLNKIELYEGNRVQDNGYGNLQDFVDKTANGLYRFKDCWYDGVGADGVTFYSGFNPSPLRVRTLDFSCTMIDKIKILKRNKKFMYVSSNEFATINGQVLEANRIYKLSYEILQRTDSNNCEYFIQKDCLAFVPSKEEELKDHLRKIIK